jgi:hypothetical protein
MCDVRVCYAPLPQTLHFRPTRHYILFFFVSGPTKGCEPHTTGDRLSEMVVRWRACSAACALAVWLTASLVAEHASGQVVKTVAGDRSCAAKFADGAGTYACFNYPTGLAVAPTVDGEGLIIYVADKMNGASATASRAGRGMGGCARRARACCRRVPDSAARVAALTARPGCAALRRASAHSRRHDGGQVNCRPPLDGLHTRRTHQRHRGHGQPHR